MWECLAVHSRITYVLFSLLHPLGDMKKKRFAKKVTTGVGRSPRLTDPGPGPGMGYGGNGYEHTLPPLPSEQEVNGMFVEFMEGQG